VVKRGCFESLTDVDKRVVGGVEQRMAKSRNGEFITATVSLSESLFVINSRS
jgi:hypothetical protein